MRHRNQWGVALPHGDFESEEELTARRSTPGPIAPDQDEQQDNVLLVDPKGRPILVRVPRPLGFRRP